MNFWENVVSELEFRNIERKELAKKAGFDVSNIGKGVKNGNSPSADTAVKIARVLDVSVEYLVTGIQPDEMAQIEKEMAAFKKYRAVVQKLDSLSATVREPLIDLIAKLPSDR